jgi:tRNA threonylcarbamoyladenosine biosynthesis protein TsaB
MANPEKEIYLLGIEASGLTSAVCISREDQLLGLILLNLKNIHSRKLSAITRQLLDHINLKFTDLSGIILSAGPGSFTGLRIGYSLAKGLAHPLNLPIVEVPTLDIWAHQHGRTDLPVLSIIDAHREEIFCAKYLWQGNELNGYDDFQLLPISSLKKYVTEKTLIVGNDLEKLKGKISELLGKKALFSFPLSRDPDCHSLCHLGYKKFVNQDTVTASDCEPRYMRAFKGVM